MPVSNWRDRLSPIIFLSNNLISRIGVALVTCAGITWLFLLPTYLQGHAASAYLGILLFLMLPGAFFVGLGLIPLGIVLYRKRLHGIVPSGGGFPVLRTAPSSTWRVSNFVARRAMW
jgi:hypothetical protein